MSATVEAQAKESKSTLVAGKEMSLKQVLRLVLKNYVFVFFFFYTVSFRLEVEMNCTKSFIIME